MFVGVWGVRSTAVCVVSWSQGILYCAEQPRRTRTPGINGWAKAPPTCLPACMVLKMALKKTLIMRPAACYSINKINTTHTPIPFRCQCTRASVKMSVPSVIYIYMLPHRANTHTPPPKINQIYVCPCSSECMHAARPSTCRSSSTCTHIIPINFAPIDKKHTQNNQRASPFIRCILYSL